MEILERIFGVPEWQSRAPVDELILTILSQNTNDHNRDLAYDRLRSIFPTWEDVTAADVKSVEAAIRPAGLAAQKSIHILEILKWIRESFGGYTLDPLQDLTDDEAIALLMERRGIGVKTAAVLLAFSFKRDLCPVDTHVHRIARRLGWVESKTSAEKTFHILRPLIPAGKAVAFHLNLLKFGRSICTARNPNCGECALWNDCIWSGKKLKT
jgi:endonuclease-3